MLNLCELFGVEEDEEFEIIKNKVKDRLVYKVSSNILLSRSSKPLTEFSKKWVESALYINNIASAEIKKLPYKPKMNDVYYIIMPSNPEGYVGCCYRDDGTDQAVEQTVGFNRTKEDALKQLKELYPNHPAVKEK